MEAETIRNNAVGATVNAANSEIIFPDECIVGSLGDAARALAAGTEKTEEGIFAALITLLSSAVAGHLFLKDRGFKTTRLYTVLVAESAMGKKSSSVTEAKNFIDEVAKLFPLPADILEQSNILTKSHRCEGVGSGEGLVRVLFKYPRTILIYDELKGLMDKAGIDGSSLLVALTKLYEEESWENSLKKESESMSVTGAQTALIGCATGETYESIFSSEAVRIGFPNRLFVVTTRRKPKVAYEPFPDEMKLALARDMLIAQLMRLAHGPLTLEFSPAGLRIWHEWYMTLQETPQARRLDVLGRRLLPLFALIMDKDVVDAETVSVVCKILDYEYKVRLVHDPIDANNAGAWMEQKIIKVLTARGGRLPKRVLQQQVNTKRTGLTVYHAAITSLMSNGDIRPDMVGKTQWLEVVPQQ